MPPPLSVTAISTASACARDFDADPALREILHGVGGVGDQIEQHLADLRLATGDAQPFVEGSDAHLDTELAETFLGDRERVADDALDPHVDERIRPRVAGEAPHGADDAGHAVAESRDDADRPAHLFRIAPPRRERLIEHLEATLEGAERGTEFVGDPGGHLAEARELLRAQRRGLLEVQPLAIALVRDAERGHRPEREDGGGAVHDALPLLRVWSLQVDQQPEPR